MRKVVIVVNVPECYYICTGVFHRLATAQIVLSGLFFALIPGVLLQLCPLFPAGRSVIPCTLNIFVFEWYYSIIIKWISDQCCNTL